MPMDELIEFFTRYVQLTDEEISFLREQAELRRVPKNSLLLEEGQLSTEFFFIVKGSVRMFYLSDFEEKTAYFYTERMFVSSYRSFTQQVPAPHNLATIENTTLIVFNHEAAAKLSQYSPKFEQLARVMMEEELSTYQDIVSTFVTQNAEERYLGLLKDRPELLQRIPQYQIATFLGVSPETLSRIRKRIAEK
jgi:CRP-like cAMP-binding protein